MVRSFMPPLRELQQSLASPAAVLREVRIRWLRVRDRPPPSPHSSSSLGASAGAGTLNLRGCPELCYQPTALNEAILQRCAALREPYTPPLGLLSGHVHTVYSVVHTPPPIVFHDEVCPMPDGGEVVLSWDRHALERTSTQQLPPSPLQTSLPSNSSSPPSLSPVLVIFPGLCGGIVANCTAVGNACANLLSPACIILFHDHTI